MIRANIGEDWRVYGHTLEDIEKGNFYLSVTTILEVAQHKKLTNYFIKNSKNAQEKKLKEANTTGSRLHQVYETVIGGEKHDVSEEDQVFATKFEQLKSKHSMVNQSNEGLVVSNDYGYAGRYDQIAQFDGKISVIDLKTGRNYGIKTGWQLAAYKYGIEEMGVAHDLGMVGIHAPRDQLDSPPKIFKYQHHESCFVAFLSCLNAFRMLYFNELKTLKWNRLLDNPLEKFYGK